MCEEIEPVALFFIILMCLILPGLYLTVLILFPIVTTLLTIGTVILLYIIIENRKIIAVEILHSVRDFLQENGLLDPGKKAEYMKKYLKAVDLFNKKKYGAAIEFALESKKLATKFRKDRDEKVETLDIEMRHKQKERDTLSPDIENGIYLTNENWEIFKNFISNTSKELEIMTNVISAKVALPLLTLLKDKKVKVRLLTRRILKADFNRLIQLGKICKFNLEIYRCPRLHAKIFIRDRKKAIIGSPNFTHTSLGEEGKNGYVEGYYVTEERGIVKSAKSYFDSIWYGVDNTTDSEKFLTSKRGGIPKKIIEMIKSEEEELTIVMNSSLIQPSLIYDILGFNENIKLKIITNWPRRTNSETKKLYMNSESFLVMRVDE